ELLCSSGRTPHVLGARPRYTSSVPVLGAVLGAKHLVTDTSLPVLGARHLVTGHLVTGYRHLVTGVTGAASRCQTPRPGRLVAVSSQRCSAESRMSDSSLIPETPWSSGSDAPICSTEWWCTRRGARHLVTDTSDTSLRDSLRDTSLRAASVRPEWTPRSGHAPIGSARHLVPSSARRLVPTLTPRSDPHACAGSSAVSAPISSERVDTPTFSNRRASVLRTVLVEIPRSRPISRLVSPTRTFSTISRSRRVSPEVVSGPPTSCARVRTPVLSKIRTSRFRTAATDRPVASAICALV